MTLRGPRPVLSALSAAVLAAPLLAATPASARTRAINPRSVRYSVVLADQLLAELHYLPVALAKAHTKGTASTTTTSSTTTTTTSLPGSTTSVASTSKSVTTTTLGAHAKKKPKVSPVTLRAPHYVWRFANLPESFKSQWSVGTLNVIFRGALMRFQAQHNLPITGNMDGPSWHALVSAALKHQRSHETYNLVVVQRALPQRVWLYRNGHQAFTSLANTGIAAAPTAPGTFTVYLRYKVTTMSGTLPNGQPYHDTGIPWTSYFNGGDALHGFIRASYGWPQSLGCVEMPFQNAKILWPYTPLGTLVTVE